MSNEADDLDRATTHTLESTSAQVEEVRRRAAPQQVQNPDGTWPTPDCTECGEPIIPERLAMARVRCASCQGILEKSNRFRR